MARWGSCNYDDFKKLQERFSDKDAQREFLEKLVKELAARLLRKVIKRTPVGQYPSETGKTGGNLRRGWTGQKDVDPAVFAQSLNVKHIGKTYKIEVINPVDYASYVEYGHRQMPGRYVPAIGKKLKVGWVEGKFMLTISEEELNNIAPALIEKRVSEFLEECINGKGHN